MKILIINPNSDENTDAIMEEKAKNLSLDGVEVDVVHVTRAPKLVCSYEEQAGSAEEMIQLIRTTTDIYDAYIVACHSDPNLELVREIAGKPVVGIAEASLRIGAAMGNGYAVISPSPNSISKKIALAHKYRWHGSAETYTGSEVQDIVFQPAFNALLIGRRAGLMIS